MESSFVRRSPPSPGPGGLAVSFERDRGVTLVGLHGELDVGTVRKARQSLAGLVGDHHGHLVVDLRDVTFMDSSAIALLLATQRVAQRTGWTLSIVRPGPLVFRVIELVGLADSLPFVDEPPSPPRSLFPAPTAQAPPSA